MTSLEDWVDYSINTPLSAARMNYRDGLLEDSIVQLARHPEALFAGAVTRDSNGAPTSAIVEWPDGASGTYSGTASTAFPGSIDAYTITRVLATTVTYAQPAVTRDANGYITTRPAIAVT